MDYNTHKLRQLVSVIGMLLLLHSSGSASAQQTLPVTVPLEFVGKFPAGKSITTSLRANQFELFAIDSLIRPRFMDFGPDGTLFVADQAAKTVWAIRDGRTWVATPSIDSTNSVLYHSGALYVSESRRVRKFVDTNGDNYFETEEPFINDISSGGTYDHWTRTILFDDNSNSIFVGVGASCNVCREDRPDRAAILRYDQDGTNKTIYATGLRNPLGLLVDSKGVLWATNADRDKLGDDLPAEIVTKVTAGGFYGWPLAYGNHEWEDFLAAPEYTDLLPIMAADSVRVARMPAPTFYLPAHSTPMGITEIEGADDLILFALHGSSPGGRSTAVGYKVMASRDRVTTFEAISGFLEDSVNYKFWGRPCGLIWHDGYLYISSDAGIPAIYRMKILPAAVIAELGGTLGVSTDIAGRITINATSPMLSVEAFDLLGRPKAIAVQQTGDSSWSVKAGQPGLLMLRIKLALGETKSAVVLR